MPLDGTGYGGSLVAALRAAREYIAGHRWCQHASRKGDAVCALGGLFAVTEDEETRLAGQFALRETLELREGWEGWDVSVSLWNDRAGRTKMEVLDLYDETILAVGARGA